jgi:arylsulfatase A
VISTAAKQLFVGAFLAVLASAQQAERPNIVIIFADDLAYGDLGVYGNPNIRTPNLDRMAAEGMRLTDFYSASSVCTPSRAALLTGRLPIRSGLNRVLFPTAPGGIPASEVTIAEALKDAGYRTAMVGKWHLGDQPKYLPTNNGFESYFGIPYSNDMSARRRAVPPGKKRPTRVTSGNSPRREMPEVPLLRDEKVVESDPDQSLITKRYTSEAVEVINKFGAGDAPFFLYYAHTMPHVPIFASEQFKDRSLAGLYGDVIEEIDWSVGEVLRAIKEVGADEKTLVIFTSDNGPWLAHKWNGGSAGPFRDGKFSTWEGGLREPFIARWPNRIPAGAVRHEVASTMDLFPTCLELAGAKIPSDKEYDGADISDLLTGKKFEREALNFYWRQTTLTAVRKGDWKLHVDTYDSLARQRTTLDAPILFNLRLDPGERYDVAEANPEIVKQLAAVLEKHSQSVTRGAEQR